MEYILDTLLGVERVRGWFVGERQFVAIVGVNIPAKWAGRGKFCVF